MPNLYAKSLSTVRFRKQYICIYLINVFWSFFTKHENTLLIDKSEGLKKAPDQKYCICTSPCFFHFNLGV